MKKYIAFLLTLIILCGALLPAAALAEGDSYDIWVGGTLISEENKDAVTGSGISGSVRFDPDAGILYLDNAVITGNCKYKLNPDAPQSFYGYSALYFGQNGEYKIAATGVCKIDTASADASAVSGISCRGSLTIKAEDLTVSSTGSGIAADKGLKIIDSKLSVAEKNETAISAGSGSLEITGSSVAATSYFTGMSGKGVVITDSDIDVKSEADTALYSSFGANISISGGSVKAISALRRAIAGATVAELKNVELYAASEAGMAAISAGTLNVTDCTGLAESRDGTQWSNVAELTNESETESFATLPYVKTGVADVSGMDNFVKTIVYTNGYYCDVNESTWYGVDNEGVIREVHELGLMNGVGNDELGRAHFNPEGSVTRAEAITMAARVHNIYSGSDHEFTPTGGKWWETYVSYAVKNGIISSGGFDDYDVPASRAEMAYIFSGALPESELGKIREAVIPDVNDSTKYAGEIKLLYEAGILNGSDGYGTFNPDKPIERCQAAAIIARVALPAQRATSDIPAK